MPILRKQTGLELIEASIADCRQVIANKQAEIRELETAAAVLRRLQGAPPGKSFSGKKIRECARILLEEKSPQHFKDIAREAVARGYVSQKGGDVDIVSRSFQATMTINESEFEKLEGGVFALKKK